MGRDTDNSEFKRRAQEAGMTDRIHFLGHRDDVLNVLAMSDAYVLPTIGSEGLGIPETFRNL